MAGKRSTKKTKQQQNKEIAVDKRIRQVSPKPEKPPPEQLREELASGSRVGGEEPIVLD